MLLFTSRLLVSRILGGIAKCSCTVTAKVPYSDRVKVIKVIRLVIIADSDSHRDRGFAPPLRLGEARTVDLVICVLESNK